MGKFEKQNRPAARNTQAQQHVNRKTKKNKSPLPWILTILSIAVVAVAVVVCIAIWGGKEPEAQLIRNDTYIAGVNVGGLEKQAALDLLMQEYPPISAPATNADGEQEPVLSQIYTDKNMNIHLYASPATPVLFKTSYDPSTEVLTDIYGKPMEAPAETEPETEEETETEEQSETTEVEETQETFSDSAEAPLDENGEACILDRTLCLPASKVNLTLDLSAAVELAYSYGRELQAEAEGRLDVDLTQCLSLDEAYIRDVLQSAKEDNELAGAQSLVEQGKTTVADEDGNETEVDCLNITFGSLRRSMDVEALYEKVLQSYHSANFELQYVYEEELPEAVDLDALYETYDCVAPVNAVCDPETYQITDGKAGYGFLMKDAIALAEKAQPGDKITLTLTELEPTYTRETLSEQLFCDILGSCKSPHVWNPTRTRNLELASQAINGTILKPGEEFSFNRIVGERTAAKGYGEAGVYVGGRTENQLGGGVCQVASAIYYSVLKADLEVVERYEHQYTPTYVPWGMDATIYWGSLDFRFRNNTAYPIRIDASVYDGYVFVDLVGTETRDYTVKLDYSVIDEDPSEEKTIYIHPDMKDYSKFSGYSHGETIQTAYDGYTVRTYMYKYDLNGDLIETILVNTSKYDRRDREVAYLLDPSKPMQEQIDEIENPTEPTEPEPTEPEPTEPEPTEPEPTEPEPTETDPTEPTESTPPATETPEE